MGWTSTVGVIAVVGRGVFVGVGGNQTGVEVGVRVGGWGVSVGSGGSGAACEAQAASPANSVTETNK
ncbi:MAG TPA: hypothetical protein VF498_07715 [Anaerolineales bacterium]